MQFKYKSELATINNRTDSEEKQISYAKKKKKKLKKLLWNAKEKKIKILREKILALGKNEDLV